MLLALAAVLVLLIIAAAVYIVLRSAGKAAKDAPESGAQGKKQRGAYIKYHIAAFAFSDDVLSIDDITATRMAYYRDFGVIKDVDYKSEKFFDMDIADDARGITEVESILIHANETQRKDDFVVLYFFDHLYPVNKINSQSIGGLYNLMRQKLDDENTILLRVEKEKDDY